MAQYKLKTTAFWSIFGVLAFSPSYANAQSTPVTGATAARPRLAGAPTGRLTSSLTTTGERLFLQCRACHTLTLVQGGKVGPPLGGLFARAAGSAVGYDYSSGLKSYGGSWTDARLDAFLAGPNRTIQGTKMAFAGMPDPARRAALIAYLRASSPTPSQR